MKNNNKLYIQIFLILFLFLLLQSCDRKSSPITSLPNQTIAKLDSVLQIVIPNVSAIRNLSYKRKVTISTIERNRLSDNYTSDSSWQNWQQYIDYHKSFLCQFGFFDRSDDISDLINLWKTYLAQFPAAFYVPGTDSILVVVDNQQDVDSLVLENWFESAIAHEFVHALQDQNFDAFRSSDSIYSFGSSDEYSAFEGITEGDACFVQNLYHYKYIYSNNNWLQSGKWWSESLTDTLFRLTADRAFEYPLYMEISSYFPYYVGPAYISKNFTNDSWTAINALYTNFPKTTAMLFENSNKSVMDISLDEFRNDMDSSQYFFSDVLGSVGLFTLFSISQMDKITIEDYRKGFQWMGDRLLYSKTKEQAFGKLVWKVTFEQDYYANLEYERLKALVQNDNNRFIRPSFVRAEPDTVISGILCSHFVSESQNSYILNVHSAGC